MGETSTFEKKIQFLLDLAIREKASDIHIDEWPDRVTTRLRVDGVVRPYDDEPGEYKLHIRRALASVLDLSMIRMHECQQGSLNYRGYMFRISVLPKDNDCVRYVMRLAEQGQDYSLDAYMMPEESDKQAIREAISAGHGGIIVSGPTGSGKTTLLYSILCSLDPKREKIILSFEHPIESDLSRYGISQTKVSEHVSFADGLREALRQDPDVMLIGETRDRETAATFAHGARTGHLMFTTMHVNTAAECIERLAGMGINEEDSLSFMRFATCQRLARRTCQNCCEPDPTDSERLSRVIGEQTTAFIGRGCEECKGTGTKGRLLIFEYIAVRNKVFVPSETMLARATRYAKEGIVSANEVFALL